VQAGSERNRHKRYALIIRQFQAATIGFSIRWITCGTITAKPTHWALEEEKFIGKGKFVGKTS